MIASYGPFGDRRRSRSVSTLFLKCLVEKPPHLRAASVSFRLYILTPSERIVDYRQDESKSRFS